MAKNNPRIGATLVLSEGNFFTNVKKASSGIKDLKKNFDSNAASVKKHNSAISSAGDGIASLTKKVIGVAAAYVSIKKVTSVAKECTDKAKTAEQANVRLNTIMQQIPGITQEAKDGVAAYCKELSKQTSIGGTAQKMGASQLASFKMSADSVKKLMPSLNNLAVAQYGVRVSGDQMIQAANMLGKAYSGQTGALTRAGVVLSDTQAKIIKNGTDAQKTAALVEVLTQNFGDLAGQMANTKEGQLVRIQNAIGGIKTTIGNSLLPVVATVTEYVAEKLPTIQSAVESATGKISPYIQSAVSGIKTVLEKVTPVVGNIINTHIIPAVSAVHSFVSGVFSNIRKAFDKNRENFSKTGELINAMGNAFKAFWSFVKPALNFMKDHIIPGIVTAIGWMIPILTKVYNFIAKVLTAVHGFASKVYNSVKTTFSPLVAAVKGAFSEALGAIKAFWNIVKPYFVMGWNNIKAILSVVSVHFKGLFGILGAYIKARIKMAVALFTAVWNTIRGIFSVVKSVLTGDWRGAWEGIKGIVSTWGAYFNTVWEGIKSVFGAVVNWFGNTFAAAWEAIKAVFSNVAGFFQNIWNTIKKMFDAVGITISESISAKFRSTLNAVFSFAGGLINNFIRGINWAVDKINALPNVRISRLSEVNIPMLAKGGVIQRAGNVIVGERGPEMLRLPRGASVTPLPAGMAAGGGTYNNTFYVTVNADDSNSAERFVRRVKEILDNM